MKLNLKPSIRTFAKKIAKAMRNLSSSHVYFIIQQAFGEIDWDGADEIFKHIIRKTR